MSFYIWGGCTWGGGRISSGEVFELSDCSEVCFRGRQHISIRVLWRGFLFRASSWHLASFQWSWQHFWGAHHPRVLFLLLDLYFSLDQAAIVTVSSIFCTCCIPPSIFLIYRHILQTGFPWGGFIQGHVDQKYLCQIYACLEEAPKYNKGGCNHPVWEVGPANEETFHMCQICRKGS